MKALVIIFIVLATIMAIASLALVIYESVQERKNGHAAPQEKPATGKKKD